MKKQRIISLILSLILIFSAFPVIIADSEDVLYKGVDLSRWNGTINFNTMKNNGVDFAILRCYSYGKDKEFDNYYEGATKAGIYVGAYVYMYATTTKGAIEEANAVINSLGGKDLTFPLFLDVEDPTVLRLGKTALTKLMLTELKIFEEAGYDAGIYTSRSFTVDYMDMSKLTGYDLWIAKWTHTRSSSTKYYFSNQDPYSSKKPDCDMWQFTEAGAGYYYGTSEKNIDLDYCYKDYPQIKEDSLKKSVEPSDYPVPEREMYYIPASPVIGDDVSYIQAVLYNLGYGIEVTGEYDSATASAVKLFQMDLTLNADGNLDPVTRNAIIDLWNNYNSSYTVKYLPNGGTGSMTTAKIAYGSECALAKNAFSNAGKYFSGWNLYRSTDKKWYCTDLNWHSADEIKTGSYLKRLFLDGENLYLGSEFKKDGGKSTATLNFKAVWNEYKPTAVVNYNGNTYEIYDDSVNYEAASSQATNESAHLLTVTSKKELAAVKALLEGENYFTGGTYTKENNTVKYSTGEKFAYSVDSTQVEEDAYLTIHGGNYDGDDTYGLIEKTAAADGFVVEAECSHSKLTVSGYKAATCTSKGYTGNKVCALCGKTVSKGESFAKIGHKYGEYATTKQASKTQDGTIAKTCSVCGAKSSSTVKKISTVKTGSDIYSYNGNYRKASLIIKDSAGKTIPSEFYSAKFSNNLYVGTAEVKITFRDRYKGTYTLKYKIIPPGNSIKKLSALSRGFAVRWTKKTVQTKGYQIEYSTNKSFTKDTTVRKTVTKNTTTYKTVTGLKGGKTYYVRVRTYKAIGDKKYYSRWSAAKTITTRR